MVAFRNSFRKWWQPPRSVRDRERNRSVTFLELFYDLVYVVIIAELAHTLATNVTPGGVAGYGFLFIIVWWAWFNGSSYHDLHGNNDVRTRVFTLLQMFTVAAMAVFAHNALAEGAVGFALSYAAFQLILTYLWWRTGIHDPEHRPLSQPYVIAFLLTTLLFISSVFVLPPLRLYLWAIALLISLLLPLNLFNQAKNPAVRDQVGRILDVSPSLVERFGLFTIIVLGEVVAGTIRGVAGQSQVTWLMGATAVLSMLLAFGIWWIYFGLVSGHKPQPTMSKVGQWFYLHLPLTAGIAAAGAAVFNIIEHSGEPLDTAVSWLLAGSVALVLLCVPLLMRVLRLPGKLHPYYQRGCLLLLLVALLSLLLGLPGLPLLPLLAGLVILLLVPVGYAVGVWVQEFGGREVPIK